MSLQASTPRKQNWSTWCCGRSFFWSSLFIELFPTHSIHHSSFLSQGDAWQLRPESWQVWRLHAPICQAGWEHFGDRSRSACANERTWQVDTFARQQIFWITLTLAFVKWRNTEWVLEPRSFTCDVYLCEVDLWGLLAMVSYYVLLLVICRSITLVSHFLVLNLV